MKAMFWPALTAAAVMLAAPAALADPGERHGGKAGHHAERMFDQLGLSAEQKQKIQAIRKRHREAAKADREALRSKWRELSQLMKAAASTREQAVAKQREVSALQARLAEARVAGWYEVRAVLTPEQLKKLESTKPESRRGWKR